MIQKTPVEQLVEQGISQAHAEEMIEHIVSVDMEGASPPKTVLFADTTIAMGGLMRCCVETIQRYSFEHAAEHVPDEPLIISCDFESPGSENIILEGGTWRWNHEV